MTAYGDDRTGDPYFVTIHTGEGILRASDMADYLDDNPNASAHAMCDAFTLIANPDPRTVPYDRAAYTAGGYANDWGLHIELCAFAQMTRAEWLSEQAVTIWVPWIGNGQGAFRTIASPMSMLRNAARWTADVCARYGIAPRKIDYRDLRAGVSGICGHADTSAAWNQTDHTDPGAGFPWDVFIALVIAAMVDNGSGGGGGQPQPNRKNEENMTIQILKTTGGPVPATPTHPAGPTYPAGFTVTCYTDIKAHVYRGISVPGLEERAAQAGVWFDTVDAVTFHTMLRDVFNQSPLAIDVVGDGLGEL